MLEQLKQFDLVYLGTPYSKYPKGLERAFQKAARITGRLIERGIKAYSPIAHTHPVAKYAYLDPLDYKIWLPFNDGMIRKADALCVVEMESWDTSFGLTQEIKLFKNAGKPVFYLNPELVGERP